ncbi:MAG: metal-dependent hydrolase [Myxococcales bacterium]
MNLATERAEERPLLAARPVRFDWQRTPLHWLPGNPFVTHFINVLHLLLPEGELWFCRVYNKALPAITDGQVAQDVRGFIQQEAIHGKAHRAVLEHYYRAHHIDTAPYTDRVRWLFTKLLGEHPLGLTLAMPFLVRQWLLFRLGVIAAIEHFTCVIGKWVLDAKALDEANADPVMLDLLRWHGAEEVEHRHVAHDLFVHMGGGYLYRLILMILVAPILLVLWSRGTQYFLRRSPGAAPSRSVFLDWHRAAKAQLLPSMGLLLGSAARYLRPSYHPDAEADTAEALAYLAVSPATLAIAARAQRAPSA